MTKKGAHIMPGDPVARLEGEAALDQNLGIAIDPNDRQTVLLESVTDEDDTFARCPAVGNIDASRGPAGKSIERSLEAVPEFLRKIRLRAEDGSLRDFQDGARVDQYAIRDAAWMDQPEALAWNSLMLAQLQARSNAVTHFLNEPAAADFSGQMTPEERQSVAHRARHLANELEEEALTEIAESHSAGVDAYQKAAQATRGRILEFVVTSEDGRKAGGLTEEEANNVCEEK